MPSSSRLQPSSFILDPSDGCLHCGLPLGRRHVTAEVNGETASFCCFGCVLAQQVTRARGEAGAAASILVRLGLAVFFAMNTMMLTLPTYAIYVYGSGAAADGPLFHVLRYLALCTTVPVVALLGWPILARSFSGLRAGAANTDALIVLGVSAAVTVSVFHTVAGGGSVYYDTAAMLLVLVTLGRYLEARARAEAGAAVRGALASAPAVARRLREGGEESVDPEALAPGDVVGVAAGDAFPTDGVVIDGVGGVDEAALTGESRPVLKEVGSPVSSGTCSVDGVFTVRVTARAADSAARRIAALLETARRQRTPAELLADRVSAVLVPAVVAIALGAGLVWTMHSGIGEGVLVALAVLVVACPCGLGIATPVAVWTGLASAAARGVVLRSGAAMERLPTIRQIVFDKTGTLTEARPRLVEVESFSGLATGEILRRAAALEAGLSHPIARTIVGAASASAASTDDVVVARDVRVVPGRGVRGTIAGETHFLGSPRFVAEETGQRASLAGSRCVPPDPTSTDPRSPAPGTRVVLSTSTSTLGVLHFVEATRDGAAPALSELRRRGLRLGMMTGDTSAAAVVPALFAAEEVAIGLSPEEKLARLKERRRSGAVAMVGDGINDAPALAVADVGIAVAEATDLARLTADVVLLGDDLARLPWLLAHAHKVRRVMAENLAWAFAYNAVAIAAAAGGLLTPVIASLAMIASSAAVVANARRLRLSSPR